MSDVTRSRIDVLQHSRRQSASQEVLSRTSDEVGEPHHAPIEPGVSLRLQKDLYAKLKEMRAKGRLHQRAFPDAEGAVAAVLAQLNLLGSETAFEVYVGANGSGFFAGPISSEFLNACLQHGHEGLAAVLPSLESGVVLDVVFDDPLRGNFYEVEWW
jgi:hypothetical protein